MLTIHDFANASYEPWPGSTKLPEGVTWIDAHSPTSEEIESSSRFYRLRDTLCVTIPLPKRNADGGSDTHPVALIVTKFSSATLARSIKAAARSGPQRYNPAMFENSLVERAAALLAAYRHRGWKMALAESCTGGLIAGLLTEIAGSSDVLERGFVVYSNDSKHELLGVPATTLAEFGAVSEPCALAMALGALRFSRADVAVSVTGIAGPGGGSETKPVGLVYFAAAGPGDRVVAVERRFGDLGRANVRIASLEQALKLLEEALEAS
jgi:nicotinamide-nucleotide amidase